MTDLKLECTARQYCIEMPLETMKQLFAREALWSDWDGPVLSTEIDKIPGVDCCDYNGHFGSFIYLRIDAADDTPETHAAILVKIRELLEI